MMFGNKKAPTWKKENATPTKDDRQGG